MDDIICHNILSVAEDGIVLKYKKNKIYINFKDCAKNYAAEKNAEFGKCIASRNITKLSFTFYTQPKTTVVFKKNLLKDLIVGKSAVSKFHDLQKAIVKAGYTSYDLS